MRLFSTGEGTFSRRTQAIEEALNLDIEGLDRQQVLDAIQTSSDERLFRVLFLAQCAELSACMPAVFEPIGSAMELLLPDNLLTSDGVIQHLVEDIPEQDWREGVEIVGWIYQYYNAERKDEFFSSKRKASASDLAPATQLFTPEWIVRYLAQNSLGRLWMLNHPDSKLAEQMKYYLSPEEGNCEDVRKIESPEEIAVCDPACGSGHILVYAFDLLAEMYDEAGYSRRDIPRLILEKNLTGFEIDPRAAQMASFALTMKACEVDTRFLRRAVAPRIIVLNRIELDEEDLARAPHVAARKQLVDAMAHLDECGSLFAPFEDDLRAIEDGLAVLSGEDGDLFADATLAKLKNMHQLCSELTRTFDTVIANPPYMGSSNMGPWLAKWTAKRHPDAKRDLCTCFLERGFTLANEAGYSAMVTMESWMFLSSFERFRSRVLREKAITGLVYMNHMVMRIAFNTCAAVFYNAFSCVSGAFTKVEYKALDANGSPVEFPVLGQKVYRRSAKDFKSIPGTPIAYWASEAMCKVFSKGKALAAFSDARQGSATGDNDRFMRYVWEIPRSRFGLGVNSISEAHSSSYKWFPYDKGGSYRKWFGNNEFVLAFDKDNYESLKAMGNHLPSRKYYFHPGVTWSALSSGNISVRYSEAGHLFDAKGSKCFVKNGLIISLEFVMATLNSSVASTLLGFLAPTLDFNAGIISLFPIIETGRRQEVTQLARSCVSISRQDWDSLEVSWDFKRHSLV